ncbi:MAG: PQQ-binding-like beta-propeller repeat protein [Solirubrobacteraceae bacterium]
MPSPDSRRLPQWGLVAVVVLLLALGGTAAVLLLHTPGNVSHPGLSFTRSTATKPRPKPGPVADTFEWPRYGFDSGRTRYFPGAHGPGPPLRVGWTYRGRALLEFPPVIYQNTMYLVDDGGSAKAIDKRNGHLIWQRQVGTLAAASPAVDVHDKLVLVPLLSVNPNAGHNPGNGRMVALSMKTGRPAWSRHVASGTESSPLVWAQSLYFGDQSGTVYSLRAGDGHLNWSYHASSAVKGGPSLYKGVLYFGDYSGRAYALSSRNGHEIWAVSTSGTHFGFGSGTFYSSPAVAFGRVYMGNTDGRVYSFATRTGQLAWATSTGSYVYASPAVADTPGLGPTVYLGSYDGEFYAFNAQTGAVRWKHQAGGKISGSATIVGDVIYYSNLALRSTAGLNARSGRQVFSFPDGAFNPVISDFQAIYLSGYATIYQMLPVSGHPASPRARPPSRHPPGRG